MQLLRRLLLDRAPSSDLLAGRDSGWVVGINEVLESGGIGRFHYMEALDAVVALQQKERTLLLLDVFAHALPQLEELIPHLPAFEELVLLLCPDRLAPQARAEPAASPDGTQRL